MAISTASFAVKDIEASRKPYGKFGLAVFDGDAAQKWRILKNGEHVIGISPGMFEKDIFTFDSGWESNAQKLALLTDIRVPATASSGAMWL